MLVHLQHTARIFKSIFEVLKDMLCDVNIYFKEDGFYIQSIDPEKMTIVNLHIDASKLILYELRDSVPFAFGIHVPLFYKLLRSVGATDVAEMVVTNESMILSIRDVDNSLVQGICIHNVIIPVEEYKVTEGSEVSFQIDTKQFRKCLKNANYITKKAEVCYNAREKTAYLIADDDGLAKSRYNLKWTTTEEVHHDIKTKFYHRVIEKMLKLNIAKSGVVMLSPKNDPFKLSIFFDCGRLEVVVAVI